MERRDSLRYHGFSEVHHGESTEAHHRLNLVRQHRGENPDIVMKSYTKTPTSGARIGAFGVIAFMRVLVITAGAAT
jgi:hypothetical protein